MAVREVQPEIGSGISSALVTTPAGGWQFTSGFQLLQILGNSERNEKVDPSSNLLALRDIRVIHPLLDLLFLLSRINFDNTINCLLNLVSVSTKI